MITYNFIDVKFSLNEVLYSAWINEVALKEECTIEEVNYIFCTDEYLYDLNVKFLNHDTYTDIITFDNSLGKTLISDIFISLERVKENADKFKVSLNEELHRVMAHGVLHLCGYKDKTDDEASLMRVKEDEAIKLFHVER